MTGGVYSRLEGGRRTRGERQEFVPGLPLISIITVVRNGEKSIEQTILSVLRQSYPNLEYLVIDGASTDGTVEIIRRYDDALEYWVSEPDSGIYEAMNKGIAWATGDLIGIINSDDYYLDDALRQVADAAAADPDAGVFHGNLRFERPDGIVEIWKPRAHLRPADAYRMPINHPTVFVRAGCYKQYGHFDPGYKIAADYDLMLRLLFRHRVNFHHVDRTLVCMRDGGSSSRYALNKYKENIDILSKNELSLAVLIKFRLLYHWCLLLQFSKRFKVVRNVAAHYHRLKSI